MNTPFFALSLLSLALLFGAPLPVEASEVEDLRDEAIFGDDPTPQAEEEISFVIFTIDFSGNDLIASLEGEQVPGLLLIQMDIF